MLQRRTKKEAPNAGGWNIFFTSENGFQAATPWATAAATDCDKAWHGWPCDDEIQKLRAAWIAEPDLEKQKAIVVQLASLTDVTWQMSGEVVLMTLLGGLGTVFGPIVGAFIVIALETYLAQMGSWVLVIQGAIFVVCVLTFRRGVVGELARLIKRPL